MRSDQARNIPLDKYLASQGHVPVQVRQNGRELWYRSPIRDGDKTPSFKVDTSINKWYDHGAGRGGNTLDLAIEFFNGSVRDALAHLEKTNLYAGMATLNLKNLAPLALFTLLATILELIKVCSPELMIAQEIFMKLGSKFYQQKITNGPHKLP